MSTQEFKPGDQVRCIETWTTSVVDRGSEYTVEAARGPVFDSARPVSGATEVLVNGEWVPVRYFEKVEAEWTVGQKVSGDDYPRLPIGSVVFDEPAAEDTVASVPVLKTGEDEWTNQGWPGVFTNAEMADDVRTLTRLGDGTPPPKCTGEGGCKAEVHYHGCYADVPPAKCDDPSEHGTQTEGNSTGPHLHFEVEPEPLNDDDIVLVWARVRSAVPDCDGEIKIALHRADSQDKEYWTLPDGIVRPNEGQVPPWIEPAQVLTDDERDRIMLAYRDGVLAPGAAVLIEVADIIRERTQGGAS